ncbi:RNA-binding protein [Luteitalea sp. TBR-22]|uniref:CRTAC1 family protein n=1 Tax=Luteitalea sp. TBR-22 TaxID=2802971 RepID=UPI001AF6C0B8|nr:CRTAC1 family protein [Luteitalea sp. TBR-22]BCS32790.1 RNA-binding protein [Luteitalea sp. TBR-22]
MKRTVLLPTLVIVASVGGGLALSGQQPGSPRFEDVAEATGLRFVHDNGARGDYWLTEIMGAGAALFDYDDDGDLDVFLVQGAPGTAQDRAPAAGTGNLTPGTASRAPEPATSRLFRNDLEKPGGTLRFTDVTAQAGVGLVAQGMGTAVGDYDGDGDVDLYVTTYGDNVLYRNEGQGRFRDVTQEAGANDPRWSTAAAFVDYDRDGDLDLFVGNYVDFTPAGNKPCMEAAGLRDYCAPVAYRPVPDRLLRNRGNGTFEDVTAAAGLTRADGNALGVAVSDFDADGWPDIYVANDATPNQLWINRHDGTFEDLGPLSGTAYNAAGRPEGSMGIAAGDYDRDGDDDLVVTNIIGETFVLYENDGTGAFEDRRAAVGLSSATAMMTGFGADWFDADNDGWLELFIANGAVNLIPSLRATPNPFRQRNQLFTTRPAASVAAKAAGRAPAPPVRLTELTTQAGPGLELVEVSRGAAFGDIDLDGRVDVLVTNNGGPVRLLRNVSSATGHWLRLSLAAATGNRRALGASVRVDLPGAPPVVRRVRSGGSYLSSSDTRLHIGLGSATGPVDATITWPDGVTQRVAGLTVDREHVIRRP